MVVEDKMRSQLGVTGLKLSKGFRQILYLCIYIVSLKVPHVEVSKKHKEKVRKTISMKCYLELVN